MKKLRKNLNPTTYVFVFMILFQSCSIYHKTPVSLEEAAEAGVKIKVVSENSGKAKYQQIVAEGGQYFGINNRSKDQVKTLLEDSSNTKIYLKNKDKSTRATIGVVGVSILGLLIWGTFDFISNDAQIGG